MNDLADGNGESSDSCVLPGCGSRLATPWLARDEEPLGRFC
jgi:hypothetical protein